jgi:phosphoglycerate kinase
VHDIQHAAERSGCEIVLPVDGVAAAEFSAEAERRPVPVGAIPEGWEVLDVGPGTVRVFAEAVQGAGTVLWNGPVGVYEMEPFAAGTNALARALAASGAFVVVAGGDAVAAVQAAGLAAQMGHICTGGGATLEFIEGRTLPGVAALPDA